MRVRNCNHEKSCTFSQHPYKVLEITVISNVTLQKCVCICSESESLRRCSINEFYWSVSIKIKALVPIQISYMQSTCCYCGVAKWQVKMRLMLLCYAQLSSVCWQCISTCCTVVYVGVISSHRCITPWVIWYWSLVWFSFRAGWLASKNNKSIMQVADICKVCLCVSVLHIDFLRSNSNVIGWHFVMVHLIKQNRFGFMITWKI